MVSFTVARGCDLRSVFRPKPCAHDVMKATICHRMQVVGWLTRYHQENQYLWWTKEEVQQWSLAAQKQTGYVLDNPFLGHSDEADPVGRFRANDASVV